MTILFPAILKGGSMLDELIVDVDGQRYVGHVYAYSGPSLRTSGATLHWQFSCRGRFIGEFPALPTDTPEVVRLRLCGLLERTAAHFRSALLPGVPDEIRLTTRGSRPATPDT